MCLFFQKIENFYLQNNKRITPTQTMSVFTNHVMYNQEEVQSRLEQQQMQMEEQIGILYHSMKQLEQKQQETKPAAGTFTFNILEEVVADSVTTQSVYIGHASYQNKIIPDVALSQRGDDCDWLVVSDGHGQGFCQEDSLEHTEILRILPWSSIMEKVSPIDEINQLVADWHIDNGVEEGYQTGSMLSMVRVYPTGLESINVGDNQTAVYIDHELVYLSSPHVFYNPEEYARISEQNLVSYTAPSHEIMMISPDEITTISKPYVVFHKEELELNATMALGHKNITGCKPDVKHIEFQEGQKVMVLTFNNAFADMVIPEDPREIALLEKMTAPEMVEMVSDRWAQLWYYHPDMENCTMDPETVQLSQTDNINVAVWRNY